MAILRGIVVDLIIGDNGTDDHIYIGVIGTGGGREFPLNTNDFDDFEANSETRYAFGEVWEGDVISSPSVKNPVNSHWANAPHRYQIDLDKIIQVYVRKGGTRKDDSDDTCFVQGIIVRLYGELGEKRRFVNPDNRGLAGRSTMVLSNGCGHQYWLVEENLDQSRIFNSIRRAIFGRRTPT